MTTKDYYKILEINKNASKEEIKKAYRALAIKWHPDKNKEDIALQKFKEISEAYQILYDDDKRTEYDNIVNFKTNKSFASYSNDNFHNLHNPFNFMFSMRDPFEIFNEVFSMISGIHNSIMAFDSLMQFNNNGMTIHIIDMGSGLSDMSEEISTVLNQFMYSNHHNNLSKPSKRKSINPQKNLNKWITNKGNGYTVNLLNDQELTKIIMESTLN